MFIPFPACLLWLIYLRDRLRHCSLKPRTVVQRKRFLPRKHFQDLMHLLFKNSKKSLNRDLCITRARSAVKVSWLQQRSSSTDLAGLVETVGACISFSLPPPFPLASPGVLKYFELWCSGIIVRSIPVMFTRYRVCTYAFLIGLSDRSLLNYLSLYFLSDRGSSASIIEPENIPSTLNDRTFYHIKKKIKVAINRSINRFKKPL